ncbi:MAG TPA: hypothetical protein VJ001_17295 [Rhodocyclaceae bacterium]|nr:hypothetical protein [Rhodocyclaceae bacterium]
MADSMDESMDKSSQGKIVALVQKIAPLAASVANAIYRLSVWDALVAVWLGLFCYRFVAPSMTLAAVVVCLASIPAIILYVYSGRLQDAANLPQALYALPGDIGQAARASVNARRVGLIAQARRLYELIALLRSGKEMLGSYANIAFLVNPVVLAVLIAVLLASWMTTMAFIGTALYAMLR